MSEKIRPGIVPGIINERCVEHGVSVMRLALGYPTGLPKDWSYDLTPTGMLLKDIFHLFRQAFLGRKIHIYVPDDHVPDFPNTEPMSILNPALPNPVDYLWAFGYTTKSTSESHFVIGAPVTYGGELQAVYVLAVRINVEKVA